MSQLKQPMWFRGLEVAAGLLSVVLAFAVFAFPGLGVATLVVLLAVGLIFAGLRSVFVAGFGRFSKSLRALSAATGVLAIILAAIVTVFPGLALLSLVVLLCFGLMVYGVGRLSLAFSLKATSSGLRGLIATVGVLDVILSAVVIALPGVALLTLVVLLGLGLLLAGIEMCVSGVMGSNVLSDIAKAEENLGRPDSPGSDASASSHP